ncbi:MAG: hypothetical protein PHQ35_07950 [Phycisphaerae bacterium]|nr:hypothetical protein [Phycisphaerae bacterium]MDD5380094.1 hypothetical protein [Phycisphaerae bacterium]
MIRTSKGVGKGFSRVVGVTAEGGPEGQSPYGERTIISDWFDSCRAY